MRLSSSCYELALGKFKVGPVVLCVSTGDYFVCYRGMGCFSFRVPMDELFVAREFWKSHPCRRAGDVVALASFFEVK